MLEAILRRMGMRLHGWKLCAVKEFEVSTCFSSSSEEQDPITRAYRRCICKKITCRDGMPKSMQTRQGCMKAKVNALAKSHPYIFFTQQFIDSILESCC